MISSQLMQMGILIDQRFQSNNLIPLLQVENLQTIKKKYGYYYNEKCV